MREAEKTIIPFPPSSSQSEVEDNSLKLQPNAKALVRRNSQSKPREPLLVDFS